MRDWSRLYEYNEENVRQWAPTSGGVYRLSCDEGDPEYRVFYVGQSDDLNRRLTEHLNPSEPDECIKKHLRKYTCYFRFIEIASERERDRVEDEQIRKYNPECNA